MRSTRLGVTLLVAQLCACAIFASKAELQLVNRLRAESDPLIRAEILHEYDTRYGETGSLSDRVTPLRAEVDEGYWQYAVNTELQQNEVQAYLEAFPEGDHAAEARRRLDQLRFFAERDAQLAREQAQREEQVLQRLEEERARQAELVRGGLERFLVAALTMPRWGTTISALGALHPAFNEVWSGDPAPECIGDTCRRTLVARYYFTQTGATRVDRSISLVLEVDTRAGRVYQLTAYYAGRGFVDWLELSSNQIVEAESLEVRETARDALMAMFQAAIDSHLTGASEVETDDEGVLARFRRDDVVVSLQEFPPTFSAGRVDGIRVTFEGELPTIELPTPDE